jgi:hypothetical protein
MSVIKPHNENLLNFDKGLLESNFTVSEIEDAIRQGPAPYPTIFPPDKEGSQFPVYVSNFHSRNNKTVPRDWLVWSKNKQALFSFPCRLLPEAHCSILTNEIGWGPSKGYKNFTTKYLNMKIVPITEDVM